MLISTELLEIELTDLRQRQEELAERFKRICGAIEFCEHLIRTAQEPLPEGLVPPVELTPGS